MQLIAIDKVPRLARKESYGRSARIMAMMLDNPGMAVAVDGLSDSAGKKVATTLRVIAEKEHCVVDWSRKDRTHFFWIVPVEVVRGGNEVWCG
jgi:hypothetical protein